MQCGSIRTLGWIVAIAIVVFAYANRANANGWDNNDFIITGAPNFPDRIGIFDHDFTFKGYLDQNFVGVQGMDFDAQGRLVALSSLNPEVRIYDPSGVQVGGFTQVNSPMLVPAGDLKVSPEGNFALGTNANGVRVFTPQGSFVRQYGNGDSRGTTYVPGDKLWSGGAGSTVKIFDTASGAQVGTFTASGQTMSYSMQYSPTTNTVLIVDQDRDAGGVFERDLSGTLLEEFYSPVAEVNFHGVTRGPSDEVFATTIDLFADVISLADRRVRGSDHRCLSSADCCCKDHLGWRGSGTSHGDRCDHLWMLDPNAKTTLAYSRLIWLRSRGGW